jgi:hypothetical protein
MTLLLRILFFILIAYVAYKVLRTYLAARKTADHKFSRAAEKGGADDMVLDPQCQTYLPKSEALWREGNYFCSGECARLFLSR